MNQFPESARRRMRSETPGEHPDADLLTAFAEHSLPGSERERVLLHLGACATCREIVSLAMPEAAEAEVAVPVADSSFRWPMLRWTAVAAAMIVVAAAVSVLVPRKRDADVSVSATQTFPQTSPVGEPKESDAVSDKQQPTATAPVKRPAAREEHKQRVQQDGAAVTRKLQEPSSPGPGRDTGFAAKAPGVVGRPLESASADTKTKLLDDETGKKNATAEKKENARKDSAAADTAFATGGLVGAQAGTAANTASNYQAPVSAAQSAPQPSVPPPPPAAEAVSPLRQAAPPVGGLRAGSNMELAKAARSMPVSAARWRVSSSGAVERSPDGKTWEKVEVDPGVTFRAMSSNSGDLWVGGTAGALFHSTDSGRTWSRVKVGDDGMWVTDPITAVDFPSSRIGFVSTASGAMWVTQDAGLTWRRRQ